MLDVQSISAGARWKDVIRSGIRDGDLFIAIFSRAWSERDRTYANEELSIAIEEVRLRPTSKSWFIPVKIDACDIPDRSIGGGETLRDIQFVDFVRDGWSNCMAKILAVAGIEMPTLELAEPLGSGLPGTVRFSSGNVVHSRSNPPMPQLQGLSYQVTGGWATRDEPNNIFAIIETHAPSVQVQANNRTFGLDTITAHCDDTYISIDPDQPNKFFSERVFIIPQGTKIWNMFGANEIIVPCDIQGRLHWSALGILRPETFEGTWDGSITLHFGQLEQKVDVGGEFRIVVAVER